MLDPMIQLASGPPRFEVDGALARITLQRPAHRNRLHNEDLVALMALFGRIDADSAIRVVLLEAEVLAERPVFCAGYNTADFEKGPPPVPFEEVVQALERLRPVTICALNGSVYGGAADLVLACDLAIGVAGVEMRVPAAALGLHYHSSGLQRFLSRLGAGVTRRAFLTAEPLDAQTLLSAGFVQELLPREALRDRVEALAAHIATLAPLALEEMKQSINELARGQYDPQRLKGREQACMASEDFVEGRRAFAERRQPVWKGR